MLLRRCCAGTYTITGTHIKFKSGDCCNSNEYVYAIGEVTEMHVNTQGLGSIVSVTTSRGPMRMKVLSGHAPRIQQAIQARMTR